MRAGFESLSRKYRAAEMRSDALKSAKVVRILIDAGEPELVLSKVLEAERLLEAAVELLEARRSEWSDQ